MYSITVTLPQDVRQVEILPIADVHIGDKAMDAALLRRRLEYIANTPNCYTILNGDLLNNAVRTGVSDIYGEIMKPMDAIQYLCDMFAPIKNRILGITEGNHEARTYKNDGIKLCQIVANQLGVGDKYCAESLLIFLKFGLDSRRANENRPVTYVIFSLHGSGGGRKEGAKAIRLADMASVVDADIFIHSHSHLPMIMKNAFYRVYQPNCSVHKVDRLFVNTGAYMDYAGYAVTHEYKPNSLATPRILLDGTKKNAEAVL